MPFRDCLGPWPRPQKHFKGCTCLLQLSTILIEQAIPCLVWTYYDLETDSGVPSGWPTEDSGQILFVPASMYDWLKDTLKDSIWPANMED